MLSHQALLRVEQESRVGGEERVVERISYSQNGGRTPGQIVCENAPEFFEHYLMGDDDLPSDNGRSGSA